MPFMMSTDNLATIGFSALIVIGLALTLAGAVLLVRRRTTPGETGSKITIFSFEVDNAGPGTIILIAGIAFSGIFGYLLAETIHTSQPATSVAGVTPAVTASVPPAVSSPAEAVPFARVTYPRSGTQESRHKGFTEGGETATLGPDTIWTLDSPSNGVYYVDGQATVNGSSWSFNDYPLGDSSDPLPYTLTVVSVMATPHCATTLDTDSKMTVPKIQGLPAGCHQFAQVIVNVTRP